MGGLKKIPAELIIFDLDGTLIDSSADIAWCANKTLNACGYPEMGMEEIKERIGWGVKPLLEKLMPLETPEKIDGARLKFLEFYGSHLVVETRLYPGVKETVGHFKAMGKKMAVVTNKPYGLSVRALDELGLAGYFSFVAGGDSFQNRKPHPEPIEMAMKALGSPSDKTAVIGDSPVDCEAAKAASAFAIGVSYGFRGKDELKASCFDVIIDDIAELKGVIA